MMTFPTHEKIIHMFQTTNQIIIVGGFYPIPKIPLNTKCNEQILPPKYLSKGQTVKEA
jgi:hypothetical protein